MGRIQATETLEAIVRSATDAIITADGEGNIVTWNPAAARMFGYTEEEAIGQTLTMVVPDRFQEAHRAGLSRVAAGGETHIIGTTVQVAGVRKDGSEFPVELSLATWVTDGTRFFSGILRDVTEQAEMSRRLAASQQRLEAILNSANDAIVSIDERGKVILWNAHAAGLFGYTEEEMIGEGLEAVIPERFREAHTAGIKRVVEGGERHVIGQTVELAGLHRDGREFPMELSLATWTADTERLFIGIIRDITERKRAEEALHVANKSLNQKNDQLEALSGKLAKYLSRQVYDSIFAGRTEVKVESYRKELTVFFSDIQGFTDLTDRLEAEPLSELLNSYLSEMAQIADEYGGTIDKFIGDGIMIFFGDPETKGRKADALACVRMALAMRDHILELRKGWAEKAGATSLHVRMGINTGYCTVGNFGSEERLDYTIVGGPVNVASRLESTAEADQIHITHETYSLVKDEIYCRPTGEIKVKGVAHELRTYEVVGSLKEENGQKIQAETAGFNLQFDATAIGRHETEVAREALQAALAALDQDSEKQRTDGGDRPRGT
jgi:PAS domain S-box-containing protein